MNIALRRGPRAGSGVVTGLDRLRAGVLQTLDYDTVVVPGSHWHTTVELVVSAQERIAWLEAGDHARVIDTMTEFLTVRPESKFARYLMMIGGPGRRKR